MIRAGANVLFAFGPTAFAGHRLHNFTGGLALFYLLGVFPHENFLVGSRGMAKGPRNIFVFWMENRIVGVRIRK